MRAAFFVLIVGLMGLLASCERSGAQQTWTCPMHPQVQETKPGKCPICGMDLQPAKPTQEKSGRSTESKREGPKETPAPPR